MQRGVSENNNFCRSFTWIGVNLILNSNQLSQEVLSYLSNWLDLTRQYMLKHKMGKSSILPTMTVLECLAIYTSQGQYYSVSNADCRSQNILEW